MAAKAVRDPSLSEQTPKDLLLNISPKYWLFLQKYPTRTKETRRGRGRDGGEGGGKEGGEREFL